VIFFLIHASKVKLLSSLCGSTSIVRLRLTDHHSSPLSEDFLSNVGAAPASLEYLTWEIEIGQIFTYRLESREGKTIAVPAELPYSGKTILDFDDWVG
jgi:hypothetical protein